MAAKSFAVKYFSVILQLALIAFVASTVVRAAGEVDPTFNPGLIYEKTSFPYTNVERIFVQADGKVLIAGRFSAVGKIGTNSIARLNADGTVDPTFHAPPVSFGSSAPMILAVAAQSDGKVIIGGNLASVSGQSRAGIARLNADGSLDTTFNPVLGTGNNSFTTISDIKITADNKIIAVGGFSYNSGANRYIARLNADGSIDSTFSLSPAVSATITYGTRAELLPDGKILFAGLNSSTSYLYRLNNDGSNDSSFNSITFSGNVYSIKPLADGKFYVGGGFSQVNGFTLKYLVRFNADGTIDSSYAGNNAPNGSVSRIEILSNNQLLIGGGFSTLNGVSRKLLAKINADGTLDNSLVFSGVAGSNDFGLLQNGKIIVGGQASDSNGPGSEIIPALLKVNADGSVAAEQTPVGDSGIVNKVYVQPDGKILIGGGFTRVDNQRRFNLVRYNSDGTLDATFNPPYLGGIYNLDVRADGKILVSSIGNVVRLNADGTVDVTINSSAGSNDAKFLSGGGMLYTVSSVRLRRATEGGVFDPTLDVIANNIIRKILVQPDGKIIVVGDFTIIGGVTRGRIARINTDGSIDQTFGAAGGANSSIFDAALQPDGNIVIAGNFSGVNFNSNFKNLARLNSTGTLDATFNPAVEGGVQSLRLQSNGKILIGGGFYQVSGAARYKIARINADGTLDGSFNAGTGADDAVLTIDVQANSKVVIGGSFRSVNNSDRLGVARLFDAAATRTPYDFDGDGRSDISVFRPSNGAWYLQQSNSGFVGYPFGFSSDVIAPADYDGDGKTDIAVFRTSNGTWYLQRSTQGFASVAFGVSSDIPVPGDFDGDGKADLAVYRPSNGNWYIQQSSGGFIATAFGASEDKPVAADYDGDGKTDIAVFRPSSGTWYLLRSSAGFTGIAFGVSSDKPVPADYDGDGKADIAVFRSSNGTWYLQQSTAGFAGIAFGASIDLPAAADYDGDGKADVAVFRPSNGTWYLNRSTQGFIGVAFGVGEDRPIPNAYVR